MSRILVTGATGLIGTNLVRFLARAGHKVRILIREGSPRGAFSGLEIEEAFGDIRDYDRVRAAADGVECIYHVAAKVNLGPFQSKEMHDVNVGGVVNICQAAVDAKVQRLIHTSTVSTVAAGSKERPATEDTPIESQPITCPYWQSKIKAEEVIQDFIKRKKLDAVIVNPSFTLGAFDIKPNSGSIVLLAVMIGGLPFYGAGSANFVDVDDVVAGHVAAMNFGKTGARYILGNQNLTHREFLTKMASVLKLRPPILPIPTMLGLPFTAIGDFLGRGFPAKFTHFNSLTFRITQFRQYVDPAKARRELNIPSTPVEVSIKKAYDWFKKEKYL